MSSFIGQLCSFISLAHRQTNFPYYLNHGWTADIWLWLVQCDFGQFLLVVVFLYRNAVKRSISLLLVLRLWHLLCTRPRGATGAINTTFISVFPLDEWAWEATLYWSLLVSVYSLDISFEPIHSNIWSFVRRFDSKVFFSVSCIKLVVVISVRCNSYHWNMRFSALESLMPGVARVSVVPGLTNEKLV